MPRKRKSRISANPWIKRKLLRRLETPEKRAIRLEKDRKRTANRRAHETILEREERLARNREASRTRRANAKTEERRFQRKSAMLEENSLNRRSKEKSSQQTIAMLREMNSVKSNQTRGVQRRKATEENNECRRYRKTTSVLSAGSGGSQNYPLQMMNDQHLAYDALLSRTIFQSQMHQMLMSMCPKTPEQMLQLGLIACPPEPFWRSSGDRPLVDSDDNDCRSTVGVECEVTIEEDEELKEKKIFAEEKPLEMFEMVDCSPTIVSQNCSYESESLTGDAESIANVKNLEEEIPQSPNCQRSAEIFADVEISEETPASSSC